MEVKYKDLIKILKEIKDTFSVEISVDVIFIFIQHFKKNDTNFNVKEFINKIK